ncbi:MAG: hypothetical protein GY866_39030 [Proteobacteria bacterium]|nr:hypothetical protein [Pseudomonadota bacterium]
MFKRLSTIFIILLFLFPTINLYADDADEGQEEGVEYEPEFVFELDEVCSKKTKRYKNASKKTKCRNYIKNSNRLEKICDSEDLAEYAKKEFCEKDGSKSDKHGQVAQKTKTDTEPAEKQEIVNREIPADSLWAMAVDKQGMVLSWDTKPDEKSSPDDSAICKIKASEILKDSCLIRLQKSFRRDKEYKKLSRIVLVYHGNGSPTESANPDDKAESDVSGPIVGDSGDDQQEGDNASDNGDQQAGTTPEKSINPPSDNPVKTFILKRTGIKKDNYWTFAALPIQSNKPGVSLQASWEKRFLLFEQEGKQYAVIKVYDKNLLLDGKTLLHKNNSGKWIIAEPTFEPHAIIKNLDQVSLIRLMEHKTDVAEDLKISIRSVKNFNQYINNLKNVLFVDSLMNNVLIYDRELLGESISNSSDIVYENIGIKEEFEKYYKRAFIKRVLLNEDITEGKIIEHMSEKEIDKKVASKWEDLYRQAENSIKGYKYKTGADKFANVKFLPKYQYYLLKEEGWRLLELYPISKKPLSYRIPNIFKKNYYAFSKGKKTYVGGLKTSAKTAAKSPIRKDYQLIEMGANFDKYEKIYGYDGKNSYNLELDDSTDQALIPVNDFVFQHTPSDVRFFGKEKPNFTIMKQTSYTDQAVNYPDPNKAPAGSLHCVFSKGEKAVPLTIEWKTRFQNIGLLEGKLEENALTKSKGINTDIFFWQGAGNPQKIFCSPPKRTLIIAVDTTQQTTSYFPEQFGAKLKLLEELKRYKQRKLNSFNSVYVYLLGKSQARYHLIKNGKFDDKVFKDLNDKIRTVFDTDSPFAELNNLPTKIKKLNKSKSENELKEFIFIGTQPHGPDNKGLIKALKRTKRFGKIDTLYLNIYYEKSRTTELVLDDEAFILTYNAIKKNKGCYKKNLKRKKNPNKKCRVIFEKTDKLNLLPL